MKKMLFILLLFMAAGLLLGQAPEKGIATSQPEEVWYEQPPTPTPLSMTPAETVQPMKPEELSCVEKFEPIPGCEWSNATQKKVKNVCEKYHISFPLIMAMAYEESRFNAAAVGDEGQAVGAWQIHPSVWKNVIHKLGYSVSDMKKILPAAEVTCYIMRSHFREWNDVYFALMAWNSGGDYAKRKLENGEVSKYALRIEERSRSYE